MRIPEATPGAKGSKGYKDAEIERAASADPARPGIFDPWLQESNLYATDSYVGVRIPVALDDDDVDGPVPAASLKAARKVRLTDLRRVFLKDGAAAVESPDGTSSYPRNHDVTPPNLDQLVPENPEGTTVGINIDLLYKAARALGSRDVRLTIPEGSSKPVILVPIDRSDSRIALVMPIKLDR